LRNGAALRRGFCHSIYLRKNAKWHDGTLFTAEDVKFSYEYVAHKDYPGPHASVIAAIDGYEEMKEGKVDTLKGVEIIDDYTVKITTKEVYAPFLGKLCFWVKIIPKHIWGKVEVADSLNATDLLKHPIGTGPFKLEEFVTDRYSLLVKNEEYWDGEPKIDKLIIQLVNPETAQAQILNKELDVIILDSINPDDAKVYTDAGLEIEEIYRNQYDALMPNCRNPLIGQKLVRQALTYAINRQGIVDSLLYGHGVVANTIYAPSHGAYPGKDKLNAYEYNPEKAIEILTKEVGWVYKNNKMYADGEPVKFRLMYSTGNKLRELMAPVIQENFKKIGIELELQLMEFATMAANLTGKADDSFEFVLMNNTLDDEPDIKRLLHTKYVLNGPNFSRYSNPKMDALFEEGIKYIDSEIRMPIYHEIAILINEEMPIIFIFNSCIGLVKPSNLKGIIITPSSYAYNAHNWNFE